MNEAQKYVMNKRFQNLKIALGDGLNFSLSGFSVIIIALGVRPKKKVLERIIHETKKGTRIIDREPYGIARFYNQRTKIFSGESISLTVSSLRESIRESILIKNGGVRKASVFFKLYFWNEIDRIKERGRIV